MADEYISKEYVINKCKEHRKLYISSWGDFNSMPIEDKAACDAFSACYADVVNAPAADVQPVKRGKWRKDEQGYDVYVECSECGLNLSTSNYIENEWREILKYCPCCGARMKED